LNNPFREFLIGSAIMGYKPLYHTLQIRRAYAWFFGCFHLHLSLVFFISEIVIVNSYPTRKHGVTVNFSPVQVNMIKFSSFDCCHFDTLLVSPLLVYIIFISWLILSIHGQGCSQGVLGCPWPPPPLVSHVLSKQPTTGSENMVRNFVLALCDNPPPPFEKSWLRPGMGINQCLGNVSGSLRSMSQKPKIRTPVWWNDETL